MNHVVLLALAALLLNACSAGNTEEGPKPDENPTAAGSSATTPAAETLPAQETEEDVYVPLFEKGSLSYA